MEPFHIFLTFHIATGASGLALFWGPMLTRKGSPRHKRFGRVFVLSMIATGLFASGMATSTLIAPFENHHGFSDVALIRGVFGWMMLYLAVLTISLAWHSAVVLRNRANHAADRDPLNVAIQLGVMLAAAVCAARGVQLGQPLMMGIAVVGLASGATNLVYIFNARPDRLDYLREHIKAGVGAGISVYTAFMAFGLVRAAPDLALNPMVWAAPTIIGVGVILYQFRRLGRGGRKSGRVRGSAEQAS